MSFVQKRIQDSPGGFGADLRELRQLRGYSLDTLSRLSGIHPSIITALEEERVEDITDPVYAERHVRTLARVLEGRAEFFLHKYRELLTMRDLSHAPDRTLHTNIRKRDLFVVSRLFVFLGFFVLVAAVAAYVGTQAFEISKAPALSVTLPAEGEQTDSSHIRVVGTTDPLATVNVNGQNAIVGPDGGFSVVIDVPSGVSTIRVEARRRYSRSTTIERHLMFLRPEAATSTSSTSP